MEGQLLVAHPLLNDGFFNRSVILLCSDNDEGSFGFITNFKTQFKLRDVRPQVKNGNFPIFEGGPVAKDQLFFLHTLGKQISESVKIKENIYFGGDFNELLHHIEHATVRQDEVRFFVGYSGWGLGQLANEISNRHWLVHDHPGRDIFTTPYNELWKNKLEEKKRSYGIFADIGFDPSVN
jgi:putative transcriptional regulator